MNCSPANSAVPQLAGVVGRGIGIELFPTNPVVEASLWDMLGVLEAKLDRMTQELPNVYVEVLEGHGMTTPIPGTARPATVAGTSGAVAPHTLGTTYWSVSRQAISPPIELARSRYLRRSEASATARLR